MRWSSPGFMVIVETSGSVLVEDLDLLTHGFLVDGLEDSLHEISTHAHLYGGRYARFDEIVVAVFLNHRHGVFLLVFADLTRHLHTLVVKVEEFCVDAVDLLTQSLQALGVLLRVAEHKRAEYDLEDLRSDLLVLVAPCLVGRAVAFDHQSGELHVEGLLRERSYELALATHVAWIAHDGKIGQTAVKLDRDVPLRRIAVYALAIEAESTVDSSEPAYAGVVNSLKGTNP